MTEERKYETVVRYAVTAMAEPLSPDIRAAVPDARDQRVLVKNDATGTFATPEEAHELVEAMIKNNRPEALKRIWRLPLAVCPVECYLPSLQPVRAYVDADTALHAPVVPMASEDEPSSPSPT